MIGLLFLALQAATTDQVVDTITATRFQTTAETQPVILQYLDCLAPPGIMVRLPASGTSEDQARARIAACAETRKWAISTGVSVYRPELNGDPDAAHFMNASLDQVEQGFLAQARYVDDFNSGKLKPPALQPPPAVPDPNGTPGNDQ